MREITKSQDLCENTVGASEKMNPNLHERALLYSFGWNIR
jgi:hypothetical protein